MLGLDKKAVEKLNELRARDDLSERDRELVSSMIGAYSNPEWHFFTSAQRKLIGTLHDTYCQPPDRKDRQVLEFMDAAIEDPNISGYERDRINSILSAKGRVPKKFSPYDDKFLRKLRASLEERARQQEVRNRLQEMLDAGEVRRGAEEFCESIIAQFDERRQWSAIQMEHAEKIVAGNRDPGEF